MIGDEFGQVDVSVPPAKMNEHQKWAARRAYCEQFSTPLQASAKYPKTANRCGCGCGGVWYEAVTVSNVWSYVKSLGGLWDWGFMTVDMIPFQFGLKFSVPLPVFKPLYRLVGPIPLIIHSQFNIARLQVYSAATKRIRGRKSSLFTKIMTRALFSMTVGLLYVAAFFISWLTTRLAAAIFSGVLVISLGFLIILVVALALMVIAVISISGLVFIVGGVASILYTSHPWAGIALIIFGVVWEYETRRRATRRQEQAIGNILLTLQETSDCHRTDS